MTNTFSFVSTFELTFKWLIAAHAEVLMLGKEYWGKINLAERLGLTSTGPKTIFSVSLYWWGSCLLIHNHQTHKKKNFFKFQTWFRFGKKQSISQMYLHLRHTSLKKAFPFHRTVLTAKASIFVSMFTNYLPCHHGVNIQLLILQKAGSQILLKYQFLFQKFPQESFCKQVNTTR